MIMANDIMAKKELFAKMMADSMDDRVQKMAFTQEDLNELYDNGEEEIYICGEDLHIPLKERVVFYLGVNNPTIVIDSDELVDFETLGISIEDCLFDEEYSKLVFAAEEDYESAMDEANDEVDIEQVSMFYESMKEYFSDYKAEMLDIGISEDFSEFFEIEELDPSDYNSGEYDYETKAKAKLACKAAITEMISEVRYQLVSAAKEYVSHTSEYYSELKHSFDEFISDLSDAYDSSVESDYDDEVEAYWLGKKKEFFSVVFPQMNFAGISREDVESIISKALNKRLLVRTLLQECDYDDDDDYYCFDLESACDTINSEIENFVSELEDDLPQQIYSTYRGVFLRALEILESRFDEMFSGK